MNKPTPPKIDDKASEFGRLTERAAPGVLRQSWQLIREEKKWYLIPVLIAFLLLGGFVLLAGSGGAPLLYTLF